MGVKIIIVTNVHLYLEYVYYYVSLGTVNGVPPKNSPFLFSSCYEVYHNYISYRKVQEEKIIQKKKNSVAQYLLASSTYILYCCC